MSSANSQTAPAPTSTNMTVLILNDQHPQPAPPEEEVEKTATGIPITLIWLPYVGFSIVLLSLMFISFFHYHKKNGHKYRRRRAELLKQFNMQDVLTQFQGTTPPNGGFTVSTEHPPEHPPLTPQPPVNPFHHRSPRQNPHFQPNAKNSNADIYPTRRKQPIDEPIQKQSSLFRQFSASSRQQNQPAYSPRGVPLVTPIPKPVNPPPPVQPQPQPSTSSYKYQSYCEGNRAGREGDGGVHARPPDRNRTCSERGSGGTSDGSSYSRRGGAKRPLTFTSNLNGSMVDVRCGVTDSHRTFRAKNNRSTSLPNSTIWTLPALSSSSRAHHQHQQYPQDYLPHGGGDYDPAQGVPFSPSGGGLHSIMSDCEDDEAFLLQQTKL